MKLIYIDEAGNTGKKPDPDQPIHMIGALIVDQGQISGIEAKLNVVARRCAEAIGREVSADGLEFHGSDLFGGNKVFNRLKPAERIGVCQDVIRVCAAEGALFGACAINKLRLVGDHHPHMLCFQFTLERVQDYLTAVDDLGLIVADEHRELEDEIIRDLTFSKRSSTGWGWRPTPITRVVDTVHFVKSRHNRLVQACDVLTYFRLKGHRYRMKLLEAYNVARPAEQDFHAYCEANAKPSEKAVLALSAEIQAFQRFHKIWPR